MANLTAHEKNLLKSMGKFDNLELAADQAGTTSAGVQATLKNILGNPVFVAQFNLRFLTYYYDVTGTALISPAAMLAADPDVCTDNSYVAFGNSDFAAGYVKAYQYVPDNEWALTLVGIYGRDVFAADVSDVAPFCNRGDMVSIWDVTAISTNKYKKVLVLRCPQVAYGTLLDALNSDTFMINMIRYKVNPLQTNQLSNQIITIVQSLFGKAQDDKIDPSTYITGQTFNQNIADIPLELAIDKTKILATYVGYDVVDFDWVITVAYSKKIRMS
jgi:hypothetical protein